MVARIRNASAAAAAKAGGCAQRGPPLPQPVARTSGAHRRLPDMQHAPPAADDHDTCAYSGLRSLASLLREQEEREALQRQTPADTAAKAAGDEDGST